MEIAFWVLISLSVASLLVMLVSRGKRLQNITFAAYLAFAVAAMTIAFLAF